MTYKDFMKNYINPYLKSNDKPYNRMLFSNSKDYLHKDNLITDIQVNNWVYPDNKYFE